MLHTVVVCRRPVSDRPQTVQHMNQAHIVRHEVELPRWERIRTALQHAIRKKSSLSKPLNKLINLEIGRAVAVPTTKGKGRAKSRLSQEWDIVTFNVPGVDEILAGLKDIEPLQKDDSYLKQVLDDQGRYNVTFIADSKTIENTDLRTVMASVIGCDHKFQNGIINVSEENAGRRSVWLYHDLWEVLNGPDTDPELQGWPMPPTLPDPENYDWTDTWDYCVKEWFPRQFVVVECGKNALVLSYDLYTFIMFYIQQAFDGAREYARIPVKNNDLLREKKNFAPPQIMKNFRFDATNVRALESAVAAAGGTLVSFIDELLKTYLGTVVAKRLVNNPPQYGDAQSALNEFNALNEDFGFTVIKDAVDVRKTETDIPGIRRSYEEKLAAMERRLRDGGEREMALTTEKHRLKANLEEMQYKIDASEGGYKRMAAQLREAQMETQALQAQLMEANDRLQMNLEHVGKPSEPGDPRMKRDVPDIVHPSRKEVMDQAFEDAKEINKRIAYTEEKFEKLQNMVMDILHNKSVEVNVIPSTPPAPDELPADKSAMLPTASKPVALPDPVDEGDKEK